MSRAIVLEKSPVLKFSGFLEKGKRHQVMFCPKRCWSQAGRAGSWAACVGTGSGAPWASGRLVVVCGLGAVEVCL